jgi:hypothetical protein
MLFRTMRGSRDHHYGLHTGFGVRKSVSYYSTPFGINLLHQRQQLIALFIGQPVVAACFDDQLAQLGNIGTAAMRPLMCDEHRALEM